MTRHPDGERVPHCVTLLTSSGHNGNVIVVFRRGRRAFFPKVPVDLVEARLHSGLLFAGQPRCDPKRNIIDAYALVKVRYLYEAQWQTAHCHVK